MSRIRLQGTTLGKDLSYHGPLTLWFILLLAPMSAYVIGEAALISRITMLALLIPVSWCPLDQRYSDLKTDFHLDSSSTSGEADEAPAEGAISGQFDGSEILVIGAESSPRLQWKQCRCSIDDLKQQLKEAGRLDSMLASKSYRYVDSQQTSLVVGSHDIQAGRSKIFKDMKEEPLKKGLLALWENEPELRDPREFENFWGVVVSLCTMNARRVRLVELLGESSVTCVLKRFSWSDVDADGNSQRRRSYLRAVDSTNPCTLGNLWDLNPSWREELGKALILYLRIFSRTGYDDNRDEFHMPWLPSGCRSSRRVTLRPRDQSWIRFLKDTTYSMTAAVVVEDSLRPCSRNRPSWFRVPSILEIALCINRTLHPAPDLKKTRGCPDEAHWISRTDAQTWKHVWDVSRLASGDHLWVGAEHRLKVLQRLSDWHLLLEVDIVKRAVLREMMGIRASARVSHWEYTDEEAEPIDIRPIPVHIIS